MNSVLFTIIYHYASKYSSTTIIDTTLLSIGQSTHRHIWKLLMTLFTTHFRHPLYKKTIPIFTPLIPANPTCIFHTSLSPHLHLHYDVYQQWNISTFFYMLNLSYKYISRLEYSWDLYPSYFTTPSLHTRQHRACTPYQNNPSITINTPYTRFNEILPQPRYLHLTITQFTRSSLINLPVTTYPLSSPHLYAGTPS